MTIANLNASTVKQKVQNAIVENLNLETKDGIIHCIFHNPVGEAATAGVVWVGGAGGGLDGPAAGLYPRLADQLARDHIASLRLDYRHPNKLIECAMDTMLGIAYLEKRGCTCIALVGHSFGGAVVILAGSQSKVVVGVAALSSQTSGTNMANHLSPRSLLLLHGSADRILPDYCSREIYQRAIDPKEMKIYTGCGHGLNECRDQVDHDLLQWLRQTLNGKCDKGD